MIIEFESVEFKNLKSYGNTPITINLKKNKTTVITGINGSGKSSILQAVEFALFGKTLSGNKDAIINSVNGKDCLVKLWFRAYGKSYKIIRGLKPNIFEYYENGKLIDQTSTIKDYQRFLENSILKFDIHTFRQIVFLSGSSYKSFMLLPLQLRRKTIDDILDINVFSKMVQLHKSEMDAAKDQFKKVETKLENLKSKIDGIFIGLKKLESSDTDQRKRIKSSIDEAQTQIDDLISKNTEQTEIQKTLAAQIQEIEQLEEKRGELKSLRDKIGTKLASLKRAIQNVSELDVCPTCSQTVSEELKTSFAKEKNPEISELEIGVKKLKRSLEALSGKLDSASPIFKKIRDVEDEIVRNNTTINNLNSRISSLNKELSFGTKNSEDLTSQISALNEEREIKVKERIELLGEKHYNDVVSAIIKDNGIKSVIIQQYVPIINQSINKFLELMDLQVQFVFDETFQESILSRFRDEFTYSSFSAGERARIDIALLFTWREVAKLKNSLSCNLLFMDEVFDSFLDSQGLDDFCNLITEGLEGVNVFMISHRSEIVDKFHSNLKIVKKGHFSEIEE